MSEIAALAENERAQTAARREEQALVAKGKALHETEPQRLERMGYDVQTGLDRAAMERLCHGPSATHLVFHQVEDRSTPEYAMVYDVHSIDPVKAPQPPTQGKGGKGKPKGKRQAAELQGDADIE